MKTILGQENFDLSKLPLPFEVNSTPSTLPKIITMKAIFKNLEFPIEIWPKEAYLAIIKKFKKKFKRIPRHGWKLLHDFYSEKFKDSKEIHKYKKISMIENIKSIKKMPNKGKNIVTKGDKQKENPKIIEYNTLAEYLLKKQVKEQLLKNFENLKNFKIEETRKTKKIYSANINTTLIRLLNEATAEILLQLGDEI
ncbi:hypothetical protein H311_04894, partial [Anncaliia algerae PRA109]